jgi:hypothetical protein
LFGCAVSLVNRWSRTADFPSRAGGRELTGFLNYQPYTG